MTDAEVRLFIPKQFLQLSYRGILTYFLSDQSLYKSYENINEISLDSWMKSQATWYILNKAVKAEDIKSYNLYKLFQFRVQLKVVLNL